MESNPIIYAQGVQSEYKLLRYKNLRMEEKSQSDNYYVIIVLI